MDKESMKVKLRFDAEFLFCLGAFLKQFYILPSGSLQIGDIFMLLSFLVCVIQKRVHIIKTDGILLGFFSVAGVINILYSLIYSDSSFLKYTSYFVFSFLIILCFRQLCEDNVFLARMKKALSLALIVQVVFVVTRTGRWYDSIRYMGSFNDPNQFGYFVLTSVFLIFLISRLIGDKIPIWQIVVGGGLIVLSASTGMLLGYFLFALLGLILPLLRNRKWGMPLFVLLSVLSIAFLFIYDSATSASLNNALYLRASTKLNQFFNGNFIYLFMKDRSMLRILREPIYLLFGSGEGNWNRYIEGNEIHGTMVALLYYYGIVPYLMFVSWLKKNLRGINKVEVVGVYVALLIEACTLVNHRQPFFWMLLVMGGFFSSDSVMTDSEQEGIV